MPTAHMRELFEKHCSGEITRAEWDEFRALLGDKYGNLMSEYLCPNCERPLLYTWSDGLACWKSAEGCGWKPPFGSPFALRES